MLSAASLQPIGLSRLGHRHFQQLQADNCQDDVFISSKGGNFKIVADDLVIVDWYNYLAIGKYL
jgi:hypothetical protein